MVTSQLIVMMKQTMTKKPVTAGQRAISAGLGYGLLAMTVMTLLEFGFTGRLLALEIYALASLTIAVGVGALYWLIARRSRHTRHDANKTSDQKPGHPDKN